MNENVICTFEISKLAKYDTKSSYDGIGCSERKYLQILNYSVCSGQND